MDSESQVSSSVFTFDETLPYIVPSSPLLCPGSQNIRRILLLHLKLIHDQQEKLLSQERELSTLQLEKSFLQCKLQRIQRRLSKFTSESQKDPFSNSYSRSLFESSKFEDLKGNFCMTRHSTEFKSNSRKKLHCSIAQSDNLELRTLIPYLSYSITNSLLSFQESNTIPSTSLSEPQLELPSFVTNAILPSSLCENLANENLNDLTFIKRHKKLEESEKRRKRWDIQRFRELHKVVDLQKRNRNQNRLDRRSRSLYQNYNISTLVSYSTSRLEKIELADTVPIFAFGRPLPAIVPRPFQLNLL